MPEGQVGSIIKGESPFTGYAYCSNGDPVNS